MAGVKLSIALVLVLSVAIGREWAEAHVHHVVGGDRGWAQSSDVGSWSSGRIFSVGDKIWFTYSAAQDKIVEVKSKEEYEACDVSNPIRMYTDGLDSVTLEEEGIRYFASDKSESCKNGLKLHVEVQPRITKHEHHHTVAAADQGSKVVAAVGPTAPSAATYLNGLSRALFAGLLVSYMGL